MSEDRTYTESLPLHGIRVLEITNILAGPCATEFLADWGAEVIRVESIRQFQDNTRASVPRPDPELVKTMFSQGHPFYAYAGGDPGSRPWNRWALFNSHARNKLSVTMDLKHPRGKEAFLRLLQVSDIFIENNVPETMEKLGLTYQALQKVKPDLIMVSIPSFGWTGPLKNQRTQGFIIESATGHALISGYEDAAPMDRAITTVPDAGGAATAALATVMALLYRRRTGRGQFVEVSQAEAFLGYLAEAVLDFSMNGRQQEPMGNRHPLMAPHGCYPCKGDGRWIVISVRTEEEWSGFCQAIGNPPWVMDDSFFDVLSRLKNQNDLDRLISEWTGEKEAYEVFHLMQVHGVPAGPVMNEADVFSDPHVKERGLFQTLTQADCGSHLYARPVWSTSEYRPFLRLPPCRLGEHNEYVYKTILGYSDQEYDSLIESQLIGDEYIPDVIEHYAKGI